MNKKSFIALLLTFMLIISSVITASAATFPDITSNHSWAKDAIESMVERGILKGYTDGTFKPDRAVTHLETLIIASRIMGVDNEENIEYRKAAVKKFESTLSSYNIQYKDEVSYLLYWNVLSKDELTSYISESTKDQPLKRYEAAILLTKLIGGEKAALKNTVIVLDFADASSIPSSAKAYVKYVYDSGLMKGMDENNFNPTGELTRAMISTVMHRAEDYMSLSQKTGTVVSVDSSEIIVSINDSETAVPYTEDTVIKVDGESTDASDLVENQVIKINYQGNDVRFIEAISSNLYYTVSGIISSISESDGIKKITLKTTSGSKTFPISTNSCTYLIDDKVSVYTNLSTNVYATLTIQAGYISKVVIETGSKTVKGTISGITINENLSGVEIETGGSTVSYTLNSNVSLIRNNSTVSIGDLAIGDSVTATITNGGIEKLIASSASKSVSGTITKLVISSGSATVTIKTSTEENEYTVTSSTNFIVDGESDCTIYDLRVGATANVSLDSTNIKSITTQSEIVSPTLSGTITYIHPTSYVMGLQVKDSSTGKIETIQTVVKSTVKVTDTTSSKISSFKALEPGMSIVAVGTSKYGVYEISQIIVTATAD